MEREKRICVLMKKFFLFPQKNNLSYSLQSSKEAALCGVLFAPICSFPQDDKAHESTAQNSVHAGVFCQPELGMEHIQYGNADV